MTPLILGLEVGLPEAAALFGAGHYLLHVTSVLDPDPRNWTPEESAAWQRALDAQYEAQAVLAQAIERRAAGPAEPAGRSGHAAHGSPEGQICDDVLQLVRARPGPWRIRALAHRLGWSRADVTRALEALYYAGQVARGEDRDGRVRWWALEPEGVAERPSPGARGQR